MLNLIYDHVDINYYCQMQFTNINIFLINFFFAFIIYFGKENFRL